MSLHVEITGSGPDLALLHGWGMHSGVWGGVREELARNFRVHAVDLPGYGGSPPCRPYDLEQLAQEVAQSLPPRVRVAGWSLGGLVAQRWALSRPEQVERLMLVGSSPCFVRRTDWPCGIEAGVLQSFAQDLQHDYAATLLRFLSLQALSGENVRMVMKCLRLALFARGVPSPAVLQAGLGILLESDLRSSAGALGMPLLVLHGERDTLAPSDAARWLAEQVHGAHLTVIPGCAHAPFLSHPAVFLQAAMEFFQ